jgi:fermentation-respiration switch protein FrsA (DUF1100 family)
MDISGEGLLAVGTAIAACYVAMIPIALSIANHRLFRPQQSSYFEQDADLLKLTMPNKEKIMALYLPNPLAKFTVLFSHGNMADLGLCLPFAQQLYSQGFSVLMYDYPGYGLSEGTPSEKTVYMSIDTAYQFLTKERGLSPKRIIAYGRSLGGAPTVELGVQRPLGGVILECAFTSAFRIETYFGILPFDKFRNLDKIHKLKCPVLVIHGKIDDTVPFWHGEKLFERAPTPKQHLWIDLAGHSDIEEIAHHEYWQAIHKFKESLAL